ncbi:MYND-type domain-containing protein [Mycena venus]|uniref:MYND-type domain-containing protein n=1 Tax=Mycena venus TaxID=2733690 RepID=A0A8H6X704_9AGAR|nr:MYND-type domain-containing protein [Mycena venus]
MSTPSDQTPLDLYSISLLLSYECISTEPRFRHAKLRDVATGSTPFTTPLGIHKAVVDAPEWISHNRDTKDGFIFEKDDTATGPDLPSNMLPSPVPSNLSHLSPKELETIFWQARSHDGCYRSVALLQHFFDLYPPNTPLRVRTSAGTDYITSASSRVILEMRLLRPKRMTIAYVVAGGVYITGHEDTMMHAVVGFGPPGEANVATVLDLASLQFGDAGRGLGGRSTFALESLDAFYDRLEAVAQGADTANARSSERIRQGPHDAWLTWVAKRVKERWEERDTKPWCGHCGRPGEALKKCSLCLEDYYCDAAHQTAAWPFHKRFCKGKKM